MPNKKIIEYFLLERVTVFRRPDCLAQYSAGWRNCIQMQYLNIHIPPEVLLGPNLEGVSSSNSMAHRPVIQQNHPAY